MQRNTIWAFGAVLLLGGPALIACAPASPPSAVVEDRITVVATVESVDMRSRDILLRGPGGGLFTVKAGPEVRNLAQVRAGDRVFITYQEALAVQLAPRGQATPPIDRGAAVALAGSGQRPAGAAFEVIRARVRIESVARATNTVTFVGPNNVINIVTVRNPEMIAFIRQLRPGDEVELSYLEAVAISVEAAPAAGPSPTPAATRRR